MLPHGFAIEAVDARGGPRALRVSWHPEHSMVVLSIWRGNTCVGTVQVDSAEVPHLVEGVAAGQRGGVVAPIVVATLVAEDVADGGVGHGHAVQATGYVDQCGHGRHRPPPRADHQR